MKFPVLDQSNRWKLKASNRLTGKTTSWLRLSEQVLAASIHPEWYSAEPAARLLDTGVTASQKVIHSQGVGGGVSNMLPSAIRHAHP